MLKRLKKIITAVLLASMTVSIPSAAIAAQRTPGVNQEDLIYFLLTDRFYDGDKSNNKAVIAGDLAAYNGGDFQGVIDKLDYIKDLGFTAIWISPVVENQSLGYHGYWATDFYKTNEQFGSMDKLKELVNTAHSKGIKVIVDLVVNHTSRMHPFMQDSKYRDWYHDYMDISDYNNQEQVEKGSLARLPDLNHENPEVRKYLIDMSKWWIKQTGIDGYRLDTVRHVPKDFWLEFSKEIKKDFPDFYLIGEVFHGGIDYVGGYQKAGIDGLLDFPLHFAINDVFKDDHPATVLAEAMNKTSDYPNKDLMGTFIDNHDVPRFVHQLNRLADERLKAALTLMMTYTGIPVMYYGTEIGMEGGFDPDNRRFMDWDVKSSVTDYVKKLTAIRKSNKALSYGDIKLLKVTDSFLSFSRKFENNTVIVAFNTSEDAQKIELSIPEEDINRKIQLTDLLTSRAVKVKDGKASLEMSPMQSSVFVYKDNPSNIHLIFAFGGVVALSIAAVAILIIKRKRA